MENQNAMQNANQIIIFLIMLSIIIYLIILYYSQVAEKNKFKNEGEGLKHKLRIKDFRFNTSVELANKFAGELYSKGLLLKKEKDKYSDLLDFKIGLIDKLKNKQAELINQKLLIETMFSKNSFMIIKINEMEKELKEYKLIHTKVNELEYKCFELIDLNNLQRKKINDLELKIREMLKRG